MLPAVAAVLGAEALAGVLATRSVTTVGIAVVVAGALLVAVVRPLVAACAVAAVVVGGDIVGLLIGPIAFSFGGFQIQLSDLLLLMLLVAWGSFESQRRSPAATPLAALVHEPAFAAFVPLITLAAYDAFRGGHGTFSSLRIFLYCIVVPVALRMLETRRALGVFAATFVGAALVASIVGMAMVAAGHNVTTAGLSTGGIRGVSLGTSFLLAAALLWLLTSAVDRPRRPSFPAAAAALVLAGGLAASGSREAWIGTAAAVGLYVLVSPLRGGFRLVLVGLLAATLALGIYSVAPRPPQLGHSLHALEQRFFSLNPSAATADPSAQARLTKWRVVWNEVKAHPVFGTGFGYRATYTLNIGGNNFVRAYVDEPENTHLWLWARMGTVGFVAWIAFNLLAFWTLMATGLRTREPIVRMAALWGAGVLLVVWSGMAFSPVSAFGSTLLLYWVALALVPVTRRLVETR